MSFFKLSTGENVQSTGNAEMSGGKMEPIPDGTKVKAMVGEAKWDDSPYDGKIIKLQWRVIDGEFKNRVIFQKLKVTDSDANKKDKAITMLAAIDANAGGKIMALDHEPTDMELVSSLSNKPMTIQVRVWEMDGDNGEKRSGNWLSAVEGKNANAKPANQPAQQKASEPDVSASGGSDLDGSIPFAAMHHMVGG